MKRYRRSEMRLGVPDGMPSTIGTEQDTKLTTNGETTKTSEDDPIRMPSLVTQLVMSLPSIHIILIVATLLSLLCLRVSQGTLNLGTLLAKGNPALYTLTLSLSAMMLCTSLLLIF